MVRSRNTGCRESSQYDGYVEGWSLVGKIMPCRPERVLFLQLLSGKGVRDWEKPQGHTPVVRNEAAHVGCCANE